MNGNIFILECITDNQNPGSESMHICDRTVDSEILIMLHGSVELIKINNLDMITTILTVL